MLKLQYFGHLMQSADSLEKILMLGKIDGRRRRGHQTMRRLDGNRHELGQTPGDGEGQGGLHAAVHRVTQSWTLWTTEQQ